jgi:hypothetical protein
VAGPVQDQVAPHAAEPDKLQCKDEIVAMVTPLPNQLASRQFEKRCSRDERLTRKRAVRQAPRPSACLEPMDGPGPCIYVGMDQHP